METRPKVAAIAAVWGLTAVLVASAAAGQEVTYGYRGPAGDCVAEAGNPPRRWDEQTGENVLWKTPLPNWGLGCPVVAGGRVFVLCEPGWEADFPRLVCLDADDGNILWVREINTFPVMTPEGAVADAKEAWHEFHAIDRKLYRMAHLYRTADDKDAAKQQVEAAGLTVGGKKGVGPVGLADPKAYFKGLVKRFNRAGLYFESWHWGRIHCIGYAYPTPVTDGRNVYVATGLHGFACYGLDGDCKWLRFIPGRGSSNAGYGGNDYCKNARSPLLWGDLLIADVGDRVRAIDRESGELVWSRDILKDPKWNSHTSIVSPVVITVGGQDVLLCYGPTAYLLPDGREIPVEGWSNPAASMLVKRDEPDVVFFTGGGEHGGWKGKGNCPNPPPAAVRFRLEEDTLKADVLWSGVEGKKLCSHAGLVYHDGTLYHREGYVFDAATGELLAARKGRRNRPVPRTRHLLWLALGGEQGGRLYGLREVKPRRGEQGRRRGVCEVYDLEGNKLAESVLSVPPAEGERREQIVATVGSPSWGFSFGSPFVIDGDRLYVRAHGYLACIGR
jgi:hypothetical protein